jgi:phospholipid transport system transporter-binding protein
MLALPIELTQQQASAVLRGLIQGLKPELHQAVVLDASALLRFDSAALAVLLEFRRAVLALGKSFAVQGLPPRLLDLAGLYGVIELLPAAPATH